MHGLKVVDRRVLVKRDTSEVAGAILDMIRLAGPQDTIAVDATGIGAGVIDKLKEAQSQGLIDRFTELREVNFGEGFHGESEHEQIEADNNKKLYANLKAKIFVQLSEDLLTMQLPADEIWLEELPTIVYTFDSKGRYVIESKEAYKKRTKRPSPDNADALAIANYARHAVNSVGTFIDEQTSSPRAAGLGAENLW